MPYTVGWLLENKIILIVGSGIFTIQDAIGNTNAAAELAEQAAASGPVIVHAISNMLDVIKQPSIAEQFSIRNQLKIAPNRGWIIIVSKPNSLVRLITNMTIQLFNLRFRMVASMEEAVSTLQKLDPTLPDLSALPKDQSIAAKTG
jgi:hypothetical protein